MKRFAYRLEPVLRQREWALRDAQAVLADANDQVARQERQVAAVHERYSGALQDWTALVGTGRECGVDAFVRQAAELNQSLPAAVADRAGYYLIATPTAPEKERVERSLQPTVTALTVLALAAGAVTLVVVGLVAARELHRTGDDQRQWWRLGVTAAERTIARYSWPRNVAQLREALVHALRLRPVGEIQDQDLPSYCHTASRKTLTVLEQAERDAIVAALKEHEGNRVAAAAHLGMSRSSLYRKLKTYAITV